MLRMAFSWSLIIFGGGFFVTMEPYFEDSNEPLKKSIDEAFGELLSFSHTKKHVVKKISLP